MIKSFKCKETKSLFGGRCPRRFLAIRAVAERKLQMLDSAAGLDDMRTPPVIV